LIIKFIRDIGT